MYTTNGVYGHLSLASRTMGEKEKKGDLERRYIESSTLSRAWLFLVPLLVLFLFECFFLSKAVEKTGVTTDLAELHGKMAGKCHCPS